MQKYISGPKLKGIKMVPPGVHMLSCNSVSRQGEFSVTTSFFISLASGQVAVRRWQADLEVLLPLESDAEEANFVQGVAQFHFDQGLAPYNLQAYSRWQSLAGYIDQPTISRLSPLNGALISITAEAGPKPSSRSKAEEDLERQLRETHLKEESCHDSNKEQGQFQASSSKEEQHSKVGRCYYTPIPRHARAGGLTPAQLTAANLDKSGMLEDLLQERYNGQPSAVIAELQFAFLAFLIGQSLEGFAQWKGIVQLLLSCEQAPLQSHPSLYTSFLNVLQSQLQVSLGKGNPGDKEDQILAVPMVDELLANSFLKHHLSQFFEMLDCATSPPETSMHEAASSLKRTLEASLGWNFHFSDLEGLASDDDEYGPVVVDL